MLPRPERRRHHAGCGMIPVRVAVLLLVEHQVLDQRLAIDTLAGRAGARDRLVRFTAGGMDDIERGARHIGDHDRAVGCLALDLRWTGIGMVLRTGGAFRHQLFLQAEHHVAVLGMHHRQRTERGTARERVVELVIVHHQRALVGHEVLEGIDAVGVHHRSHLVEDLLRPGGHRHVERVVADSLFALVPPATAALVPHSKSSAETVPMKSSSMCVCGSMPPGRMSQPPASMISQPVGAAIFSPTATILSASIRTSARREWSWLITVPPRMSMAMEVLRLEWFLGWNWPLQRRSGAATTMLDSAAGHDHFSAASVTAWVQAPSGFLVMTVCSPPAPSSVVTVRS